AGEGIEARKVAEQDGHHDDGDDDALHHLNGANANEALEEEERFEEEEEGEGAALPDSLKDERARFAGGDETEQSRQDGEDGEEDDEGLERETAFPAGEMVKKFDGVVIDEGKVADLGIDDSGDVDEVVEEIVRADFDKECEEDGQRNQEDAGE